MSPPSSDSVVFEEEIYPEYEPTEEEVGVYAEWLGMDLEDDQALLWIAREALKAPLPDNWKSCRTMDTLETFYFNFETGESSWDHTCDAYYRNIYGQSK